MIIIKKPVLNERELILSLLSKDAKWRHSLPERELMKENPESCLS